MRQSQTNNTFEEKHEKLERLQRDIFQIMQANAKYQLVATQLQENIEQKLSETKLRIAFVGQYSAGKSTIISALTNIKDIKIDSDVATDVTKDYEWNNIIITDTPGIGTDNIDHDEKTYDLLKKADIIVYCLTYSLFNPESLSNFKKIAFEKKYANKILLLVNKMDSEEGVFPNLVNIYTETLKDQLMPHNLEEFPITFVISAFELDNSLKEYSNFADFRFKLNELIRGQDKFSKLDSIAHTIIDTVEDNIIDIDELDSNERIKLSKMVENKFDSAKRDFNSQIQSELAQLKGEISSIGIELSKKVTDANFEEEAIQSENKIHNIYENMKSMINKVYQSIREKLELDLVDIGRTDTFKNVERLGFDSLSYANTDYSTLQLVSSNMIKGTKVVSAMSEGTKYTGGLLKASTASGSNTHNAVKFIGQQIGYKFQPWQAVNIAKNIGNIVKIATPVIGLASLFLDYQNEQQEEENARKLRNIQNDVRNSYIEIGENMYRELKTTTNEINENDFDNVIAKIREERKQIISTNEHLGNTAKQLMNKVNELKMLIDS